MPNVTQHGSFEKNVHLDESQITSRLEELLALTRSKGYVHTARMIEEALNAHSFEHRHLGKTQKYLSELQHLKRKEMTRLVEETGEKMHSVPNFRSARSKVPGGLSFDTNERPAEPVGKNAVRKTQAAFVLTPRMRVDHRNTAALRSGVWRNRPMSFPAEPEFKFR
ncbi:hypothetical protein D1823_07605 [Ruegeria sp. AD91A]|uniref:hypothetical protein n=1 Tax=Ruegeria sp. AD91A TaxID=2293862 RepID=UPI000E4915C9|nr:hypothetical protein [Ruegeria sp. AD91A]AXT26454.1 hypothetical protein D1823_07605 [Ruegeria sp. AD91A]